MKKKVCQSFEFIRSAYCPSQKQSRPKAAVPTSHPNKDAPRDASHSAQGATDSKEAPPVCSFLVVVIPS